MSKTRNVQIDRLEIRLKGTGSGKARGAIDGLGQELMRHLAAQRLGGSTRIDAVDAGALGAGRSSSSEELRKALVERIGEEIIRKIG